jgi:hypothetical protein
MGASPIDALSRELSEVSLDPNPSDTMPNREHRDTTVEENQHNANAVDWDGNASESDDDDVGRRGNAVNWRVVEENINADDASGPLDQERLAAMQLEMGMTQQALIEAEAEMELPDSIRNVPVIEATSIGSPVANDATRAELPYPWRRWVGIGAEAFSSLPRRRNPNGTGGARVILESDESKAIRLLP